MGAKKLSSTSKEVLSITSQASACPISPPSNPFTPTYERDPRIPEPPKWDGRKDALPEPQYLPQFKNYQFRYGAYPGYRDCSKKSPWSDGAVAEHVRRQESPLKAIVGKKGRTTFKRNEPVCGDLQFGKPTAKKAHEFIWYHVKDPNQFNLKPTRKWNPGGTRSIPPRPFYNREDGHFLLNNTCTIANLCFLPELQRLQCWFFPKLPKIRKERNLYLPMKKHGRQPTKTWRWTETWKQELIPWYTNSGLEEPKIAEFKTEECRELDNKHTRWYYLTNKERIDAYRASYMLVKVETPPPKPKPIDYHVKLGKETLNGVLKVKELFEDPILWFWVDPPVDIMEIILAEEGERKRLAQEAEKKNPTPPSPPSMCDDCNKYVEITM